MEKSYTMYKLEKKLIPYLFLLPNLLIFGIFVIFPAFFGLYYSFTNFDGLFKMDFIGFKNYINIFHDTLFWHSFLRTTIYALVVVPLIYVGALGTAILLTQKIILKGIFRAIIYWPTMVSFIVVGLIWKWIFGDSFGVLNYFLELIGKQPIPWLSNGFFANITVIIATLWSRIGFYMVIFLAALESIPTVYYEAADIDGASPIRKFFNITLPLLKPTSLLVIILSLIDAFKAFPLILALTGGGPGRDTTYVVQHIYQFAFIKTKMGYASAMSVILFLVIAVLTWLQFKVARGGEI
ncbi:MAG: sugar ABC transporter permease [Caldanaerobacter subterraneus]|uniref:carbohydrate ABC transporter permease n=1 Tax=Caldanaerobacter subterraneus TaxID=911092 RepID=UPI0019DD1404|nr:sugar ABC transporter permease [Caldanaerobacter subterraneus]